jgi:hypothetical protein
MGVKTSQKLYKVALLAEKNSYNHLSYQTLPMTQKAKEMTIGDRKFQSIPSLTKFL